MTYLFDTDTLSNLLRRAPSPGLLRRLATVPPDEQCTSSVTLSELLYGSHRLRERAAELVERIERTLVPNLAIVPFDADAARACGALRAELERRGTPIGDAYMRIASIALANDLIVVTGDTRHFERVPALQVENWFV